MIPTGLSGFTLHPASDVESLMNDILLSEEQSRRRPSASDKALAQKQKKLQSSRARHGISPFEIILDSEDFLAARDWLAASMTQVVSNQTHRRFAYGPIVTEATCTVYTFHHSGAVASLSFNYL
ncbi:hypothetical protein JB92DRAFT_3104147 [Gautieria morchelliformis]|nr:hypothetical protein JB92DRAFT_3104147 [Gautieria morchelliformis]